MAFLRVVELLPPLFPLSKSRKVHIDVEEGIERFLVEARSLRQHADVVLVADVKDPRLLKLSTLEAAAILKERLRVNAAPVLVVRDSNRIHFLSAVMTGLALKFGYLMLAWGDSYSVGTGATNVRDFSSLAESIREAALLRRRTRAATKFFAPVDVEQLATSKGVALAKGRIGAGADYLLAQPPTTDIEDLEKHVRLLRGVGLEDRVLLNVFPFKDLNDVRRCEAYFGWRLPRRLHRAAKEGGSALFEAEREVTRRLREGGLPGLYLNARGIPGIAESLLS